MDQDIEGCTVWACILKSWGLVEVSLTFFKNGVQTLI